MKYAVEQIGQALLAMAYPHVYLYELLDAFHPSVKVWLFLLNVLCILGAVIALMFTAMAETDLEPVALIGGAVVFLGAFFIGIVWLAGHKELVPFFVRYYMLAGYGCAKIVTICGGAWLGIGTAKNLRLGTGVILGLIIIGMLPLPNAYALSAVLANVLCALGVVLYAAENNSLNPVDMVVLATLSLWSGLVSFQWMAQEDPSFASNWFLLLSDHYFILAYLLALLGMLTVEYDLWERAGDGASTIWTWTGRVAVRAQKHRQARRGRRKALGQRPFRDRQDRW